MGVFYAGKDASVQVGATNWKLSEYNLELDADILDTTNFGSGGYKENIAGLSFAKIQAKGPYYTGGSAMTAGASYTITITVGGAVTFAIPFRIGNIKVTGDVKGVQMVEFSGESNGSLTAAVT